MLVAVGETAASRRKQGRRETTGTSSNRCVTLFAMRHAAFAALAVFACAPVSSEAQIVPAGANAPKVIGTANGVPQVNVQKPSGAGVSLNTYSQFDVQKNGAILNNSPVITNTQLAGQINGNPNFGANDAAKIIVNQVNSNNPSQLRGYVEVAGQKTATVVIANPSGLVVDGGGFINTSRGILTTGNPLIDAIGNLSGFNVAQGNITVQGDGFNASNIDQADLIARAVQVNAAIYGNALNVVSGANTVDYATLNATAVTGNGTASGVSIDVSQLGGMYANRITLVGTESGVGVANAGTIAAQAGDLTLTTAGRLVQSGHVSASGTVAIAAGSVANSGTLYAQQNAAFESAGALVNSGILAAQQDTAINAGSVASTGLLGAGIDSDGAVRASRVGNLTVSVAGLLSATGQNVAAGSVTLDGLSVDLSNAQNWAGTALDLTARAGDLSLANAATGAGASVTANVAATLDNSGGTMIAPQLTIRTGNLTNRSGTISQTGAGATAIDVGGTFDNTGGSLQTNSSDLTLTPTTLINDDGTIADSGSGTLSVTTGLLSNSSGTIASNGVLAIEGEGVTNTGGVLAAQAAATMRAGSIDNGAGGQIVAQDVSIAAVGTLSNAGGSLQANGTLDVAAQSIANDGGIIANGGAGATTIAVTSALTNTASGQIGGNGMVSVSAGTLDNSNGQLRASELALYADSLANRGGTITQTGTAATRIAVSGTLDNAGGALQTNGADVVLDAGTLVNDGGTIADSGDGTLSVSSGALTNLGGTLATNGSLDVQAASVGNQGGTLAAPSAVTLGTGSLDNREGGQISGQSVSISDTGAFNNAGGIVHADGMLRVSAQTIANDSGAIVNGGTGATTVAVAGALTNTSAGVIGGNGDASVSADSIDNSGGSLIAGAALSTQSAGTLQNTAGLIQASGDASVSAQAAIDNTQGQIGANGTLHLSGASLDNASGRVANTGTGETTLDVAAVVNSNASGTAGAGVIGGNGDVTISGRSLSNTDGGQVVAGHDLTLDIAQSVNNSGGALSAVNALTIDGAGATVSNLNGSMHGNGAVTLDTSSLENTSGRIGNDEGSGGSVAITTGTLTNQSGAIGSDRNLTLTTNALAGDGTIIAGQDGAVTVNGDYVHGAANLLQANHDLAFTVAGNLTNHGALAAVNALTVSAANVDNQADGDFNSAGTTIDAAGAITNEGRIEGDVVTTKSATLSNTATIIGDTVTLNGAQSIANAGSSAIIAGASAVNMYSPGAVSNTGGANVFSLGDVTIAADAARDANGLLANRADSVTNDQSTIQAQGSIEIAAQALINTRPAPDVQTVTTDVETVHQTKRAKYIGCTTPGTHDSQDDACRGTETSGEYQLYANPTSATYAASQVVSQSSGPDATDRALVVNVDGTQQTIWYNTATTNPDGSVTVVYWDAYDPNINYDPATEYRTRSDAHNGYQRVEIARDTTTTTQQDQVTTAGEAQQGQLLAGGNLMLANVGTLNNEYSAIAAGASIQIGSTTQNNSLDTTSSGAYGGTLVNNVGQTLYQYQQQAIVSTFAWNEDIGRDRGSVIQPSIVLAPVAIGGTGGTIVANDALSIGGTDIKNTNVAAANSATGATGGTLGANGVPTSIDAGRGQTVDLATGQPTTVNAPQTVADSTGALQVTLPTSGLYSLRVAPNASYLIETDPRFTSYTRFISSDYMLSQLGLNPQDVEKRLGDGLYEQQLVQNQITQLTGRVYLQGYGSNLDEYTALMTAGANVAHELGLQVGVGLSAAQMDALTSDIVWLVSQPVTLPDGSTQNVLEPQVYLAQTHANDLQPSGALIAADDIELHAIGAVTNTGVIAGGTQTVVTATNIVNRAGTIASSSESGTTVVSATNDVLNASGLIEGNRVAVVAGNDIVNTTLVDASGVSGAAGNSKVSQTLLGAQGTIAATGDLLVGAGNDLTVHGANITAGGDASISAERDLTVDAVQSVTSQSLTNNANHHWEQTTVANETSAITAGGNLAMQSGNDMTLKGAQVTAGGDLAAAAGGDLNATAVTDTMRYDNVAADSKTRQQIDHTYDEQAVGTNLTAGGNATLAAVSSDASKGNVTLTGSSLTAGMVNGVDTGAGAANIAATGNVTLKEAREEHDDYQQVESKRGSFVSSTTTDTMRNTQTNLGVGSVVSGDTVNVQAGKDLAVQGSTVAGTNDVDLAAAGNINITTSQDAVAQDSAYRQTHSGIGTSGLSVTIGRQSMSETGEASAVTNNASVVGSIDGNLNITAGNDLHVTGSDLVAGGSVMGTASNVVIDAATDTTHQAQTQKTSSSGLTIGLAGSIGDAINNAYQQGQALASGNSDGRATALHAIAATGDAAIAGMGAKTVVDGGKPDIGIKVSIGSSKSENQSSEDQATQRGSSVQAGGSASFVATGDGTPGSGNVTIAGSDVSANDVVLAAKNQVDVLNTTSTDSTRSSNSSSSASVGVQYTLGGGFGISAAMANAHGAANSDAVIQNASHVTGANSVTIVSGGDTNITGSQVAGKQVTADVGGNLNIASVQDTTVSAAHQSSSGGGFTISQGGGSASFSAQNGHADGDYAQVNEQAGIQAGSGGFDVNVKGDTDLRGAVISSTADAEKNSVTTGTLTYSDIQNQSHYSANSNGIDAGVGVGSTGKAAGPGSVSGASGITPMMSQNDGGNESATTRSAIGAGTISVTNQAAQTQDMATLSRDTTNTNGTVAKTPDVNDILNQQADTMAAAQAAGQVVAQGIGAYADAKQKAAQAAGDQAAADAWDEGGTNRTALHVVGGALIGGLGGGSAFSTIGGAAGAYLASSAAKGLADIANGVDSATGSQLIGNLAANVVGGLGGALVGGTAGSASASNVHLYNQSMDDERQLTGESRSSSPFSQSPLDLILQGIANGLSAVFGMPGEPPTAGTQGVLVNSPFASPPITTGNTSGYGPGNATLNSGNGDDANSGDGDKSTFWSSTKDKTPVENAYGHSTKHGDEFPEYQNSVQYVQAAQDFVNNPPDGTLTKTRPNGDTLYYDPATNTFASKTKDGAPKTMFKPAAGMDYWNKQ